MRDMERDIIPFCRSEGMAIAPYGALNQSRFQTAEECKVWEGNNLGHNFIPTSERDKKVSAALAAIAEDNGRKIEHLEGKFEGLEVELTEEKLDKVQAAYEFDPGFPHTFLSGTLFNGDTPRAAEGL
ncbi:hypothetical protein CSAL01_03653 [Colletotrichum salicis]|uniref:Aldo/keto reductase n=1 Tax=Colletotrichum salicis TaxID=1209931 RepID=A0A135RPQ6_9PEZI|nr:hypothetical protein CSAL01_03653 [Colletotrichum salicis]